MRNLIISYDTYSWLIHTAGLILSKRNEYFEVIVVRDEHKPIYKMEDLCDEAVEHKPIYKMEDLCDEAVVVQRRNDMFIAGKELGVKKISNLKFDGDVERLVIQLNIFLKLGGFSTIYYQYQDIIHSIINGMDISQKLFTYGRYIDNIKPVIFQFDDAILNQKADIIDKMVGLPKGVNVSKNEILYEVK